jgi:hypothetical protein
MFRAGPRGPRWRLHTSRTGSLLRPFTTAGQINEAATAMGPAASGPGRMTAVMDPDDSVEFARTVGPRAGGQAVSWCTPARSSIWTPGWVSGGPGSRMRSED